MEERLVAIWEDLTASGPVGIDDDFFELGGNSLLAARLFAEIHKTLGKNLPLETLVSAPTIEQLAAIVSKALGPAPRPLVFALKASGSRAPFFAIPGTEAHLPGTVRAGESAASRNSPSSGSAIRTKPRKPPYPSRIEDLAAVPPGDLQDSAPGPLPPWWALLRRRRRLRARPATHRLGPRGIPACPVRYLGQGISIPTTVPGENRRSRQAPPNAAIPEQLTISAGKGPLLWERLQSGSAPPRSRASCTTHRTRPRRSKTSA